MLESTGAAERGVIAAFETDFQKTELVLLAIQSMWRKVVIHCFHLLSKKRKINFFFWKEAAQQMDVKMHKAGCIEQRRASTDQIKAARIEFSTLDLALDEQQGMLLMEGETKSVVERQAEAKSERPVDLEQAGMMQRARKNVLASLDTVTALLEEDCSSLERMLCASKAECEQV